MNDNWWEQDAVVEQPKTENWWEQDEVIQPAQDTSVFEQDTPVSSEVEDDLSPPEQPGLTREQIVSDPGMMNDLRQWMTFRKGQQFAERSDDEVYDAFEEHMRTVESGELTLIGEIQKLNNLDEGQKELANRVYQLWDNKASAWSEGWGEFGEAAWDRVSSSINPLESPSIVLGLGVGRLATKAGAKTVGTAALKTALRAGGKAAAKKVVRQQAIRNAAKAGLVTAALDAPLGALQDLGVQTTRIEAGVQDEVDYGSVALSGALSGVLTGGLSAGVTARTGNALGIETKEVARIRRVQRAKAASKAATPITNAINGLANRLSKSDWDASRMAGDAFDVRQSQRKDLVATFFDTGDPNSIVNILARTGMKIDFADEATVTSQVIGAIDQLPPAAQTAIKQSWQQTLGVSWDESKDKLIATLSENGREFAQVARAKQLLDEKMLQAAKLKNPLTAKDMGPEWTSYVQSVWKRLLISHPATSAVNVQGWAIANATRTTSEVLQSLFTITYNPQKGARMAKAVWDKRKMYADLYGTKDQFDDVLTNLAPSWYKNAISRETFGGVASKNPAQLHRIPESGFVSGVEKTADMAARVTFVNAQDEWTRAISAMQELDRQVRIHTGKSYAQLVRDGEENLLETADWAGEAWGRSLETALKDTFSYDYSLGAAYGFNRVARMLETASNTPVVGFVFPFGKFVANAMAYTARHTVLGPIDFARFLLKKDGYEATKALSDSVIGLTAIGMLGMYSYEKMQEGFQWNQVETDTGDIVDIGNLAPLSQITLIGRMTQMMLNGDPIPAELRKEFANQIGVGTIADVGTSEFVTLIKEAFNYLSAASAEEGDASWDAATSSLAKIVGGIAAGFTRPIDPINDAFGMSQENNIQIDRRMAKGPQETFILEFSRYVDQLLAPIMGEGDPATLGTPARSIARPEGDIRDPNPGATMSGLKRSQPLSWTDKALGMVNLPLFKQEVRSAIPEFDNIVFGKMAPILDERMKVLLGEPFFKKASTDTKKKLIRKVISEVKEEVVDEIESGEMGLDPYLANERRKFMTNDLAERREALAALDLEDFSPRELTYEQLIELNEFMEMFREESKDFLKNIN